MKRVLHKAITLKHALSLEVKGLKRHGRSAYSLIKEMYRLEGSKQKVHDQLAKLICPIHDVMLIPIDHESQGLAFCCIIENCTVLLWKDSIHKGGMPTPADQQTRTARNKVHNFFDPLWETKEFKSRYKAYRWLSMKMEQKECHIGLFTLAQCEKAIKILIQHRGIEPELARLL